jgi:Tol biopolymer transport system component/DNA-binding winged helix-turn-helix (wHTH) protein
MLKGPSGTNWEFEGFKVMEDMRLLIAGGTPVPLTSKAFDTLVILIENSDRVVTKDELLRSIWPDVVVEEGNLTQQIFLVRKALGETAQQPRHIVTIPGRGYRFAARVTAISGDSAPAARDGAAPRPAAPRPGVALVTTGIGVLACGVMVLVAMGLRARWMPMEESGLRSDFTRHIAKITESGKATLSAVSRDGRYVAYVENDGDEYSLWVTQVATNGKTPVVARQPLPMGNLSFSPNGDYLYFGRRSPRSGIFILFRVPAIGGLETALFDDVDTPVSFSPDGREFVFGRGADPESHIIVAAAAGGTQRILAKRTFPARFSAAPDWSPDGKVVAAAVTDAGNAARSIVLLPVDGGTSRELYTTASGIGRLRWLPDGSGLLAVVGERLERRLFGRVSGGAIWRIAYPSGRAERLTSDLANHDPCCLDIGANGSVVVSVVSTLVSDLWIAPADHLDAPRHVTWDHPVISRHGWLPDNDTIVYRDLSGRVNAVHKDGRAFSLPVPDGEEAAGGVSACGDGRYVVFSTLPAKHIWRMTPTAGGPVRLTRGFNDFNPACSPDGQSVLYASREPGRPVSLWRISIEGGTPASLDLTDTYDVLPSPSGRHIYYVTDAMKELALQDRSATTQSGAPVRKDRWIVVSSSDRNRVLTVDAAGDRDLSIGMMTNWAPDESGLDYVVTRNGVSNIWRQPLDGGSTVQITHFTAGRIFSFAWSPDGRWLSLGSGTSRSDVVMMSSQREQPPAGPAQGHRDSP